jgi:translation initiation factor 2 subunit 3
LVKKKTDQKAVPKKEPTKKKAVKKVKAEKSEGVQPVINIGLVGHVDHGKTTLTEKLSGKWTDTHSEEIRRGITIRLGYADIAIYKDKDGNFTSDKKLGKELVRKISLVDAPGHESLMATMLAGTTIIDGAILMVAANEECPQPQTREHLQALTIMGVKNVLVVQNKIDLVDEERALKNYKQVQDFLKGTAYEKVPIIPLSAVHGVNIDALLGAIEEHMPTPKRDVKKDPLMLIARSFDVNKPGSDIKDIRGGILGGSVLQGSFNDGDIIEIKPGYKVEEKNQMVYKPLKTKIVSIITGGKPVKTILPGGSMAMMTELDPSIVKSDALSGNVVGLPGKLPPVWNTITLEVSLLERVVGASDELVVQPLKMHEALMLNVNSAATVGIVLELKKNIVKCKLKLPVCCDVGSRVTISRLVGNRFRLIGYGIMQG